MGTRTSSSRRSVSTSRRNNLSRKTALARGANFHVLDRPDMRWLYVAYVKGAFDGPEGMSPQEFDGWVEATLQLASPGMAYVLTSPFDGDDRPVGLVVAFEKGHILEPHVWWFPWATPRNKIETSVKFLSSMRFTNVIAIFALKEDRKFYDHLLRYGMMHLVGTFKDWHGLGKDARVYQTRGYAVEV